MGLESATYISGLVDTNPAGSDNISQGDDHLILIKAVLKTTLPNANAVINGIHSGAVAPTSATNGLLWFDEGNDILKLYDGGWISLIYTTGASPPIGSKLISTTHAIQSATSYMRSETYIDTGFTITHNKLSASSTLYVQLDMLTNFSFNFDSGAIQAYMKLTNDSGTLITNTTDNIQIVYTDDVDHSSNPTWNNSFGNSRLWKVLAADCPDGTTGNNEFQIWQKMTNRDDGGVTLLNGTMMVWEVE